MRNLWIALDSGWRCFLRHGIKAGMSQFKRVRTKQRNAALLVMPWEKT